MNRTYRIAPSTMYKHHPWALIGTVDGVDFWAGFYRTKEEAEERIKR